MSRSRTLLRLVVGLLIAIGVTIGLAGSAAAHNVLISSNPADNATVEVAPSSVSFTFDQPIQNFDPVISLVGPDGKQYATGTPVISGDVITGTVTAGPAGSYTAAYRIVSADGHPVTGEIHFTLAGDSGAAASGAAGSGAAAADSTPSAADVSGAAASSGPSSSSTAVAATAGSPASSGGLSGWLWIGLIVAAVVVAAAAVVLLRRPARTGSGDKDY